tara:strand:- start:30048 stop:30677 length:630 start_codon:yes stop_codon:yes gene_type:complete
MKVKATYRLDKELLYRLHSIAEEEGRTHTWYVSTALNQYFMRNEKNGVKFPTKHEVVKASKAVAVVVDDTADKVIDYLNSQAGTRYKHADTNRKLINARLKEYTKREVFDVITKKCAEWKGSEMEKYLRPSTLFNATKFEEYLNQKITGGNLNGQDQFKRNTKQTPIQQAATDGERLRAAIAARREHESFLGVDDQAVRTQVVDPRGCL